MAESAVIPALCDCQGFITPEIRLCSKCHRYWKDRQEFISVTKVIKTLLPADYSGIDETVLEIARLRGIFVDSYFSEWLRDPASVVDLPTVESMVASEFPREHEKHAKDTVNRIDMLLDWWIGQNYKATAVQKIVHSVKQRVAGQLDVATEEMILDVKCVSKLQPNYQLQLGAYYDYDEQVFPAREVGIIHVQKDRVKLVPFKAKICREQWRACLEWYQVRHDLIG